jgi:hypothetical protein
MDGAVPPLNPAAARQYSSHLAAARKHDRSWDPVARCKPPGEPRVLVEQAWPFELMQSQGRVDFLFQWNRLDRSVAIAATQALDALAPFYFGQSIGRWEGDTLVVTAIAIKDSTFLDPSGLPHTDDMVLTERFRVVDAGQTLEVRLHIVDPQTYTQPWDARLTFRRLPVGTRIAEDVCVERLKLNQYATVANSLLE